jgi:hypothetical protein
MPLDFRIPSALDLEELEPDRNLAPLPHVPHGFFVPHLEDLPQNPILETLKRLERLDVLAQQLPPLEPITTEVEGDLGYERQGEQEDIWTDKLTSAKVRDPAL